MVTTMKLINVIQNRNIRGVKIFKYNAFLSALMEELKIADAEAKRKILNQALFILFLFFMTFFGYAVGRIGHILTGYRNSLHHWILALLIVLLSTFFYKYWWGKPLLFFGIGFFISDLNDFMHFRIISPDVTSEYVFWGVD
jgi:hypothetical protein